MVNGMLDKSFRMSAYVQNGAVTFAIHHNNGTMYYSEKNLGAIVEHLKVYTNKEKQSD